MLGSGALSFFSFFGGGGGADLVLPLLEDLVLPLPEDLRVLDLETAVGAALETTVEAGAGGGLPGTQTYWAGEGSGGTR